MYTQALVKLPAETLVDGITTADLGQPDYDLALRQHQLYRQTLEDCGVRVKVLEAQADYPDSVFIEDAAVVTSRFAVITRPGAPSRRGEVEPVREELRNLVGPTGEIESPGILDGGDVMQCGFTFFVGLSSRTNREGFRQFSEFVGHFGYDAAPVSIEDMLHLKTGVAYLEYNNLLISRDLQDHPAFSSFNKMVVPPQEAYAANSLWINGRVLVPEGFPQTLHMLKEQGYKTIPLPVSEFRKLDGGLSCLSLRF